MSRPRRPDPPPMQTNDVGIAAAGTVSWAIALIVLVLVDLPPDERWWLWACVSGIIIGLFAMWYTARLHRRATSEPSSEPNSQA